MGLRRRQVLKYGLGGALILACGGAGLSLQPTRRREPARSLQALGPRAFSILAAVADRMVRGPGIPPARSLEVAEAIDALLAESHPALRREIEQVLTLLENGAFRLLRGGKPRPFTALAPDEQDRVLRGWRQSRWRLLRTAHQALHGLCMAVAFSNPASYPGLGYPGPPPLGVAGGEP